jgi:transposase-like protein
MRPQSLPVGEHLEFMEVLGELTHRHNGGSAQPLNGELAAYEDWQSRPLDAVYPVIVIDSLRVLTREATGAGGVAVHVVLGLDCEGYRHVLGMWSADGDAGPLWPRVLGELKARGVADVCVVCCDEGGAVPEAAVVTWPQAVVQRSVVRLNRACTHYAAKKDRTPMAQSLRAIHTAATEPAATDAFNAFSKRWQAHYPAAVRLWREHWTDFATLWKLPPEVRRVISTTSHVESINAALRKVAREHGQFPSSRAALTALYLALQEEQLGLGSRCPGWKPALQAFTVHFDGRLPVP